MGSGRESALRQVSAELATRRAGQLARTWAPSSIRAAPRATIAIAISRLRPPQPHAYYAGRKMANQQPARASSLITKSAPSIHRGDTALGLGADRRGGLRGLRI